MVKKLGKQFLAMKLIDNHCHMDFPHFDEDREEVLQTCREKLDLIVNCGSSPETNISTLELASENPGFVYPCIGLHPTRTADMDDEDLEKIKKDIEYYSDRIVGVGEIGMDFHHEKDDGGREKQKRFFREFLEMAEKLEKPAVVHSRDAEKQVMEILEDYEVPSVIMHCFNGSIELAKEAVDRGYYISVSTQVLYSKRVQRIVEETPKDRILLETDSPFLYPGDERNFPYNVHESLEKIADIRDEGLEELGEQFNRNTRKAYLEAF